MELNPVLRRFAQRAPLPVMVRAVLERCLNAQELDAWFEQVAQAPVHAVAAVFERLRADDAGGAAPARLGARGVAGRRGQGRVSLASLYNKLNGLEVRNFTAKMKEGLPERLRTF